MAGNCNELGFCLLTIHILSIDHSGFGYRLQKLSIEKHTYSHFSFLSVPRGSFCAVFGPDLRCYYPLNRKQLVGAGNAVVS